MFAVVPMTVLEAFFQLYWMAPIALLTVPALAVPSPPMQLILVEVQELNASADPGPVILLVFVEVHLFLSVILTV